MNKAIDMHMNINVKIYIDININKQIDDIINNANVNIPNTDI